MNNSLDKYKRQQSLAIGIFLILTAICLLAYVLMIQLRSSILF